MKLVAICAAAFLFAVATNLAGRFLLAWLHG